MMTPDPQRDVMVYQVSMIDALSSASIGDRWSVWIGRDNEGVFDSESEAVAVAVGLAVDNGGTAWLVKDGGEAIAL